MIYLLNCYPLGCLLQNIFWQTVPILLCPFGCGPMAGDTILMNQFESFPELGNTTEWKDVFGLLFLMSKAPTPYGIDMMKATTNPRLMASLGKYCTLVHANRCISCDANPFRSLSHNAQQLVLCSVESRGANLKRSMDSAWRTERYEKRCRRKMIESL